MATLSISLFLFGMRGAQLLVVMLVILLLFGAGRIPQIMRNLGKGVHSFKQGIEDAKAEMNKDIVKGDVSGAQAKGDEKDA